MKISDKMSAAAIYAMDLMEEEDMEEAKERLEVARKSGIDRTVWHVYDWNTENYPNFDRGFLHKLFRTGEELKSSSESQQSYILRLIKRGDVIDYQNQIHLVKDRISLNFNLQDQYVQKQNQKVKFYDSGEGCSFGIFVDIEDVEGIIEVRNNNLRLDYKGWNFVRRFPDVLPKPKPDEVVFHK